MTNTMIFPCGSILFPAYFRADKFVAGDAASEFAGSLIDHFKGSVRRTAGNAVIVYGIIFVLQMRAGIQRDEGFPEVNAIAFFIKTEGISGKESFI